MLGTGYLHDKPVSSQEISEKQDIRPYHIICLFYTFILILSNIAAVKVTDIFGINIVSSIFFFPMMYVLSAILTEVYGFKANLKILWFASSVNLVCAILLYVTVLLPNAPDMETNIIFNNVVTLIVKSFFGCIISFFIGNYISSYLLSKTKVIYGGRFITLRIILTSIAGLSVETIIFITTLYAGSDHSLMPLVLVAILTKSMYQVILYPLTMFTIEYLKNRDQVDHFDFKTKYCFFTLDS